MMTVTDLMVAAFGQGMLTNPAIHERWIGVMRKLSDSTGAAPAASLASDSRLDLLLRVLESEALNRLKGPQKSEIDFSYDILFSLSECWVLRAYEVIRAAWERMGRPDQGHERMKLLYHRLGLARIPIAKGEIQQAKKAIRAGESITLAHADGSAVAPYVNDGSYIVPRGFCPDTGAAMWIAVEINPVRSVAICRRDLSDEFLSLYD